jgi:chromosome segregation ATPase
MFNSRNLTFDQFKSALILTMNESATRKDIDEVIDIMKDSMSQVSAQFNEVNNQFDEVNKRLDRLDRDYNHLINTIDGFIGRIDKYEAELAARNNHLKNCSHELEKYPRRPTFLSKTYNKLTNIKIRTENVRILIL